MMDLARNVVSNISLHVGTFRSRLMTDGALFSNTAPTYVYTSALYHGICRVHKCRFVCTHLYVA